MLEHLRRRQETDLLVLLAPDEGIISKVSRGSVGAAMPRGPVHPWASGDPRILRVDDDVVLTAMMPVETGRSRDPWILAGIDLRRALRAVKDDRDLSITVYDNGGTAVAWAAEGAPARGPAWPSFAACTTPEQCELARRPLLAEGSAFGRPVLTLLAPWDDLSYSQSLQAGQVWGLGVSVPITRSDAPFLDAVKGARVALGLFLAAMIAVLFVAGRHLLRVVLRQVAPLREGTRALAGGSLTTRVPVLTDDELGELSQGFNQMAEQLQARTQDADRLYQELADALASKEALFRHFAHELRTPLQVIRGNAELVTTARIRARTVIAGDIMAAADDLSELVDEILDLVRLEAGQADLTPAPTDLAAIVDELRSTIDGLATEAGVEATVEVEAGLPAVRADARRLKDVIRNLVSNATKYTPAGGRIGVRARVVGRTVLVEVWDTGIGIPRAAQAEVFLPFRQVEGVSPFRGQPSSGLGLAIAATVVEAHGSTLRVTSAPGEGSTFSFTLDTEEDQR
jgi:signal transduction histidine kinase